MSEFSFCSFPQLGELTFLSHFRRLSTRPLGSLARNSVSLCAIIAVLPYQPTVYVADHEAPIVVCDCIAYLRNKGFHEEGIFRITGNIDVVNCLKEAYNNEFATKELKTSSNVSVLNNFYPAPAVADVASLLKRFFYELKEPVGYIFFTSV